MDLKRIVLIVVLALLCIGCGFTSRSSPEVEETAAETQPDIIIPTVKPTKTPSPEQAVEPAVFQEPTAQPVEFEDTAEPEAEISLDGPRFFLEEFDDELDELNWSVEMYSGSEDEDPYYEIDQRRGALMFYLDSPYLYLYRFYNAHLYQDIRIDFEVENKGANTNNIGAICRLTDYGWYEFITTSGGYYSIMRYDEYGDEELGYGGIKSISFGTGKKNVYTFICEGKHLILIVNDVEIADVVDEEIEEEGTAGINVSAEEVLPVQVEFNWIQFSEP